MALSISTDEAVQMLQNGWTVTYSGTFDDIEWRSPRGISGSEFHSDSLDNPPNAAIDDARRNGEITLRHRERSGG